MLEMFVMRIPDLGADLAWIFWYFLKLLNYLYSLPDHLEAIKQQNKCSQRSKNAQNPIFSSAAFGAVKSFRVRVCFVGAC